jgi:hypothetical protein
MKQMRRDRSMARKTHFLCSGAVGLLLLLTNVAMTLAAKTTVTTTLANIGWIFCPDGLDPNFNSADVDKAASDSATSSGIVAGVGNRDNDKSTVSQGATSTTTLDLQGHPTHVIIIIVVVSVALTILLPVIVYVIVRYCRRRVLSTVLTNRLRLICNHSASMP